MIIKIKVLLMLVIGTFMVRPTFCKPAINTQTSITLDTSNYIIIKYNKSNQWMFKDVKPINLTIKEIEFLNVLLNDATAEYNLKVQNEVHAIKPLQGYKKQFVPVINEKGEKEVWINCLCQTQGSKWRKDIVLVDDGGSCYFNLKINLTTKRNYHLVVNGEG